MIAFLLLILALPNNPIDAIRAGAPFVHVPLGTYVLSETLAIPSNVVVWCEPGTVIETAPGSFRGVDDVLILMQSTAKSEIHNCIFRMRKSDYGTYEHPAPGYVPSENRHAISILGARNIKLVNVRAESSGGDGLFVGTIGPSSARVLSENITVIKSTFDNNLRQGISVIGVKNLLVEDCVFSNTKGASPQAGIDFEPEYRDWITAKVVRCHSAGNRGAAYMIGMFSTNPDDKPSSIVFEDCTWANVPDDQINFRLGGVLSSEMPQGYLRPELPVGTYLDLNGVIFHKKVE